MKENSVSVIIPTYNYGRFLTVTINSVLAQSFPVKEIILVDDGSTDETEEIVKTFGDKIIYIKQKNAGLSAARNTGMKNSSGDYIAFLDADDIWLPQKIEKQLALFQENDQIGLVFCGMREFDTQNGETIRVYLDAKRDWVAEYLLLFEEPVVIGIGSTGIIKRKVFETIGNFDTTLTCSEDWDYAYRTAGKYKFGFVQEVLVDYRNHNSNMHKNIVEMERSMLICFEKAFRTDDESILQLRKKAYGNLHSVLAGSYFHAGNYMQFFRHTMKSLRNTPEKLSRFMMFPLRWLKRRSGRS